MSLLKCSAAGSNAWIRALCIQIKCKLSKVTQRSCSVLALVLHYSISFHESHAHGVVCLALAGGQDKVGVRVYKCVWRPTGPAVVWRPFSWPAGGMCTVSNLSVGPALIWPLERQNGVRRLMVRSLLSLLFIFHVPTSQGGSEEELKTLGKKSPHKQCKEPFQSVCDSLESTKGHGWSQLLFSQLYNLMDTTSNITYYNTRSVHAAFYIND